MANGSSFKYIFSDLASELKEQTKSLIELGVCLNTFGSLIDGKTTDFANVQCLKECYDRNSAAIESCVFKRGQSINNNYEESEGGISTDQNNSSLANGEIMDTTNFDNAGMVITRDSHYCRKCRSAATQECVDIHPWTVHKRKHPVNAKKRTTESVKIAASYKSKRYGKKSRRKTNKRFIVVKQHKGLNGHSTNNVNNNNASDLHENFENSTKNESNFITDNEISFANDNTEEKNCSAEQPVSFGDDVVASPKNTNGSFDDEVNSSFELPNDTEMPLSTDPVIEAFLEICDAVKKMNVPVNPLAKTKLEFMKTVVQCPICNVDICYQYIIEHVISKHDSSKELAQLRCCPFCNDTRGNIAHLSNHVMWKHVAKR